MDENVFIGELIIRDANFNDMTAVFEMIQELADFEKMSDGPKLTVKDLQCDGFETKPPKFQCKVAQLKSTCYIIGYAIYFPTYSTWEGKSIMLEDLYVRNKYRRRGVGYRLFSSVTMEAIKMGCSRLDFHVLAWNDARRFYEAVGAQNLTETSQWCYYRLSGNALISAASQTQLKSA